MEREEADQAMMIVRLAQWVSAWSVYTGDRLNGLLAEGSTTPVLVVLDAVQRRGRRVLGQIGGRRLKRRNQGRLC